MASLIDAEGNKKDLIMIERQIKILKKYRWKGAFFDTGQTITEEEDYNEGKPEMEGRWKRHCELLSELSSMMEKFSLLHKE